jgi:hypothetical protein
MYSARLSKSKPTQSGETEPPPKVRLPRTMVQNFVEGDRSVIEVRVAPEDLAELEAAGSEIEIRVLPDDSIA